ncbi:hypothetical protein ABB37_01810 [Leptomonas pyrrhocoris]|uniref:Uncharacterized protein n=1 Tax=Leptomonas pyrrhocoris TaxID=157538 RepID=A0A0M9G9Q0_LEPPY|nr:hypothetical protein ABB37_01810 [Leptomonas pyrrhocoris]KPA85539.1 hypothetical protein ABB37_01810 [Leptomonas pyrrhocoris]|eukprot:XP_015663978.1 hypothetical protein ABB37_01810 [Leptomonas pyrrhocoris]
MTSSMLPLGATAQRVTTLECAPCALRHIMRRRGQTDWTPPLADFAVDIVAGALTLADATEVLVPSSLVHYMENQRVQRRRGVGDDAWPWPQWDAALHEHKLVTWTTAQDATRLLCSSYGARYTNLCVPVPAGPLVSRMDFSTPVDVFYSSTLPALLDAVSARQRGNGDVHRRVRWRAWMRSALTCAYEGTYVPPIRMSDYTSQLLRQDGGCAGVIWEAAVKGLTPRWLETATKTALAVGVASSALSLSLPEESSCTARLLAKSVEVGITSWTTCVLSDTALYAHADPLCTPQSLHVFTTGWNALSETAFPVVGEPAAVTEAEASLARCTDFADAVQQRFHSLLPADEEAA